jgi:DNA (cytosine-5)-methyltransferase 1
MSLTITDLFCGAGGSGLGAHAAGFDLRLAANHWAKAIETHAANFPDTEHDCADISQVDPRRYPATDVLWASPECTNHSQAKGRKRTEGQPDLFGETLPDEAAERSRATMWDVPRFVEAMLLRGRPYRAVVVENVVEAVKWIPFRAWLSAMECLGYGHQIVSLNSMHAQAIDAPRAPQSRDRLYVVFHRAGQRRPDVSPRPSAWCSSCSRDVSSVQAWKPGRTVGRYRAQYVYVCPAGHAVEPYALPAAAAIDWGMPGQRIGDRVKPLSVKTMARIEAGLRKYSGPQIVGTEARAAMPRPVSLPKRTQTAQHTDALVVPYYGASTTASSSREPIGALTTRDRYALVVPSGGTWRETATSDREPFATVTTRETDGVAFIAELRGGSSDHRPVTEPLCTVTASGNHHMLVRHNSSRGDGGEMCTPASEPARTMTTTGHQSLVSIEARIEDATFRMLEPHEIQSAMAFTPEYRVLGNRREKVRQLGNGVTPPAAEFLLRAVAASLDVVA